MASNWKHKTLGNLIKINANSIKKDQLENIYYIDIKSVGSGTYDEPKSMQLSKAPSRARRLLQNGDTVISSVRPGLKSYFYAQNLKLGTVASTGFIVLSPKVIDGRFLYYLTTNDKYIDFLVQSCTGSAYPAFGPNVVSDSTVYLPESIPEQKAIASILSAIDDKIELNLQMNKTLEEMAMTLYKHWFVDFGPFKDGKFVESELGMIPEGWEVKEIHDIIDVVYGAPFKSKLFNEKGIGYPLIRIRDLKTGKPQYSTEQDHPKKTIIYRGDILAGMDALFTPYAWSGKTAYLNQRVVLFKPKHNYVTNRFILEAIKPWLRYYEGAKVGTTVIHLGKSDIDKFKFVFPLEQTIINEYNISADLLHQKIINNYNQSESLISLRTTLLPKLINGEVRLKEFEKQFTKAL